MPTQEVTIANRIKRDRRVGQRFAERVAAGQLGRDDVDLAFLYFVRSNLDERLEALGFLDDELGLDDLTERMAKGVMFTVKNFARLEEVEAAVDAAVSRRQAERARAIAAGEVEPKFVNRAVAGEPTERSRKNFERDQRAAVKMVAVHLIQRAMYVGLSRALLQMADDQRLAKPGRALPHGALQTGARVGRKRQGGRPGKVDGIQQIDDVLTSIAKRSSVV